MRRIVGALSATAAAVLLLATPALAQSTEKPVYKLAAEIAVQGTVESVRQHAGWMGWDGVYITLRTDQQQTFEVHVAPKNFLDLLELVLAPGDRLEIKGCLASFEGGHVLLIREVRKERVVINLRDAKGDPVW